MKITDVDILALSEEVEFGGELSEGTLELVNRIMFDFGNVPEPTGDVIIVCGNSTCVEDRVVTGVEVLNRNPSAYILLSGCAPKAKDYTETEAERMRRYCVENGVSPERIIMEPESTTTRENILFSAPLVHRFCGTAPRVIAVSSASHMRRVLMNYEKYLDLFPQGTVVVPCQSIHPTCRPQDWQLHKLARSKIARELELIYKYVYERDYPAFEF